MFLKQSTAVTLKIGPFVDETDGKTAETALTISQADVRLSKNGGNMAQKNEATSCTHDEIGVYDCPVDTTDTNTLGRLQVYVHESGALPVWAAYHVLPANVWDSLFSTDKLQVHVDEMTAGIITATVIADGAIDAATLASDTITAAKIATGAITAAKFAAGAIDAAAVASDTITAAKIATGAITAAKFAAGAIDAAAVASDIVAEIVDGVWDESLSGHALGTSTGEALSAAGAAGDPWGTALPGAYTAGEAGYILGTNLDQKISLINQDPGAGAITFTYTLTNSVGGAAISGADVWVSSDSGGTTIVASGTTNGAGQVVFYLDAGTYYFWRQKAGWNFTNPDTETVN